MSHRVAWISDPHLDRPRRPVVRQLFKDLASDPNVSGVLLTGDISNGKTPEFLRQVAGWLGPDKPCWFVLGNHDCYGGEIAQAEDKVRDFVKDYAGSCRLQAPGAVVWLTEFPEPVDLGNKTCLVGTETWWDGGYTGYRTSVADEVIMAPDHLLIRDFRTRARVERRVYLERLSYVCALRAARKVEDAWRTKGFDHVFLAVHVPPFRESCPPGWGPGWVSHFCSRALGDALLEVALRNPDKTLHVLAGHTHRGMEFSPCPNLRVSVAAVASGRPRVDRVLEAAGPSFGSPR